MNPKLVEILACTSCHSPLTAVNDVVVCSNCTKAFTGTDGVISFVSNRDRPERSKNLGGVGFLGGVLHLVGPLVPGLRDVRKIKDPELYRSNARTARRSYEENPAVRDYVDSFAGTTGAVVDLASGPGGGFIAPILDHLSQEAFLVGTDACPPVIRHQYDLFKSEFGDRFEFIDTDLSRPLPFGEEKIAAFTSRLVQEIDGFDRTLLELGRCLKSDGFLLITNIFYAPGSMSAAFLEEQGSIFQSADSFICAAESRGFRLVKQAKLREGSGKKSRGNGFPLGAEDEWSEHILYFEKAGEEAACG